MTIEEIRETREVLQKQIDIYGQEYDSEGIKALNMAIKFLEQEPVLDKIRAEIAEYGSICVTYAITDKTKTDEGIDELVTDVLLQAKRQVLDIIDKYKKSEG